METFLIYILKAAALSSIFLLGYLVLLKNDTSFSFNRYFLLGGIFSSFLLPGMEFTRKVYVERAAPFLNFETLNSPAEVISSPSAITDWWQIAGIIYLTIVALLLARLAYRFYILYKLTSGLQKIKKDGFTYCISSAEIQPFSFFKYIVYNPHFHSPEDLAMILKHERTHAKQWHSIDVLLVNLLCILLWFNPFNKWYKNNLIQNLEYMADQETAAAAPSKKAYQKAILKASIGDFQPVLANQFYQSFLKKRILMLNKNSSQKPHFWKLSLVLPFILLFLFTFNVKTEAQEVSTSQAIEDSVYTSSEFSIQINQDSSEEDLESFTDFLEKRGISLRFFNIERTEKNVITHIDASFHTKSGKTGSYAQSNSKGISSFEFYSKEYGETGFREAKESATMEEIGLKPLVILEGEKFKTTNLYGKYILFNKGFEVLSAEETYDKFGIKSKDGALVITKGEIVKDIKTALKNISKREEQVVQEYLSFREGIPPAYVKVKKSSTRTVKREDQKKPGYLQVINSSFTEDSSFMEKWGRSQLDTSYTNAAQFQNSNDIYFSSLSNKEPLIIIDGEIQGKNYDLSELEPERIKHLNVFKEEAAIEKYGKKGENDVLEVTLKSNEEMSQSQAAATAGSAKNGKVSYRIEKITFEDDKHADKNIVKLFNADSSGPLDLLIVVDGEVKENDFNTDSIDHTNVESITVLKGDKAVKKYGQKAKKGVLEITMKK